MGEQKRYGNVIFHACAHTGTHYADITGEADWVNHMGKVLRGKNSETRFKHTRVGPGRGRGNHFHAIKL